MPEAFFFFSKEAKRSEKTGEGRSEKKKPLVAAGTNLTSMCTYFEIDCWLVSTIYLGCHWLNSSPRSKPVFLVAGRSCKQRKWQRFRVRVLSCSTIRVEYWIYKYSGTESCSRRSPTKHYQAGRCVSGSTKRMWEIFDISTCAEVCAHLADRGLNF